ncbi:MAG TPA: VWA domain-containing protein [Sulfuriferula sp.]|nr:VWA domain-containing protein [Sulfuriferula sp.]
MTGLGELAQLDWRNPWWLALALQPLLMAALQHWRRGRVLHYADAHLLPWALRGTFGVSSNGRRVANMLAWLLLACAAAGPRLPLVTTPEQRAAVLHHELNVMVVLDVSPSMLAQDVSPQRLQRARLKLFDLLSRLHGERIGLIVFSGSAGLLLPLTRDMDAVRADLPLAQPTLLDTPGSNIAAALKLARQTLLAQSPGRRGAVLLLTDGDASALSGTAGAAALEAARRLKRADLPLYVLGVGTPAGATIPLPDGGVVEQDGSAVTSRLDENGFATLARLGGGAYQTVQDGDADWEALYDRGILGLPGNPHPVDPAQSWRELYAWCLLPAWLLLLFLNYPLWQRAIRPEVAGWLLVGVVAWGAGVPSVRAADADTAQAAYTAYRSGNYVEAQALYGLTQDYPANMGAGAAAYRRRDYVAAASQFTHAMLAAPDAKLRADALYNLGNSYFAAGNFGAAADAYQGVLRLRPRDANARANLALAAGRQSAASKPDAYSAGILGRRGSQVGGALNQEIGNQPVTILDADKKTAAEIGLSDQQLAAHRATLNSRIVASSSVPVSGQAVDAALKKLELTTDKGAVIQKQLLQLDAGYDSRDYGVLLPW